MVKGANGGLMAAYVYAAAAKIKAAPCSQRNMPVASGRDTVSAIAGVMA